MSVERSAVTADGVLVLLRKLPPRERLRVIAAALPETERALSADSPLPPLRSLLGLCADLGPAPSTEEMDQARREAWATFPRDDL